MDEQDIQEAIESYMNIELASQPPDDDVDWWRLDETGDLANSPAGQTDIPYDIEQEYPEEIPIYDYLRDVERSNYDRERAWLLRFGLYSTLQCVAGHAAEHRA